MSAPATFYTVQGGNDIFWRTEAPAEAIGARLCIVPESEAQKEFGEPEGEAFKWVLPESEDAPPAEYPQHEGAAIWTRPDPFRAAHIEAMKSQGILTISEIDDNYIADPNKNIFTRANGFDAEVHLRHLAAMASSDRIIFSTEWLRDFYWKAMTKYWSKSELPEPFVCRNNIDEAAWPTPVAGDGAVRVTWMGSPSHVWDVDLVWAAMLHAKRNLGCETWLVGYSPANPDPPPTIEKGLEKREQWRKVEAKEVPWIDPSEYHRVGIPADIGLCPLLRNYQTLGKSDVKFLEYTMSGAAVIASNNEVYNKTIIHGETGLLAGSDREFLYFVEELVRKPKLRRTLVENAQQYVREERGLKQLQEEWGAAVA